jgi:hypothetical protein
VRPDRPLSELRLRGRREAEAKVEVKRLKGVRKRDRLPFDKRL